MEGLDQLFHHVNAIFCIVSSDGKQEKRMRDMFANVAGVVFEHEVEHENKDYARFLVHQKVMWKAIHQRAKYTLIVEDDIEFAELDFGKENVCKKIMSLLSDKKQRVDLVFLGCDPDVYNFSHPLVYPASRQQLNMGYVLKWTHADKASHAYIASLQWMEHMVMLNYELLGMTLDEIFYMNRHAVGVFPSLVTVLQPPSKNRTSIEETLVSLNRNWHTVKNMYVCNFEVSIRVIILALLFLILVWLFFVVLFS